MANAPMIHCSSCGEEMAKNAKACPHCGARNKRKHPVRTALLLGLGLMIVLAAASGGEEVKPAPEKNAAAPGAETKAEPTPQEKSRFAVGEKAELKGVAATMVGVEESSGSRYNQPTDGNVFVICEFEIENDSKDQISISSVMSFDAYCDDYSLNYSLTSLLEKEGKGQLDGTVAPGKKMNGVIGYEVPADWKELEIHFTPSVWSGKDIIFYAEHS